MIFNWICGLVILVIGTLICESPMNTASENRKIIVLSESYSEKIIISSTTAGFEPTREFPSGFLVHHLNHSVK
jgi:hypothetical protein